jgi:hypothetical protein
MFLWLEPKEKIICGLMRLWIHFSYKEWALREGKDGNTGRSRHKLVHFIGKTISFSLCDFPAMLKAEGSLFYQKRTCK